MNWRFIIGLVAAGWLCGQWLPAMAADDNPYQPIIVRNVFGLNPIPTNPPVDPASEVPPPKITPNGIMTIFGRPQVLFKVAGVARPGQPPKDESYMMCEGDRQDDIEVQKIDVASATVTFDNHGVVQPLSLVVGAASGGTPAAASPGFAPPGIPAPGMGPGGGGPTTIGFGGRFGRNRGNPAGGNHGAGGSPSAGGMPGFGAAVTPAATTDPSQQEYTPEQAVIMMEAQRAKWKSEGNSAAAIIPMTPFAAQLNGVGAGGGEADSPSATPGQ